MKLNPDLETFWLIFPKDQNLPIGIGVTAVSEQDAFQLLQEQGIDKWLVDAKEILIQKGLRIGDLDQKNVRPNIGPMQFRGVWYPINNIGFGAPRDCEYNPMSDSAP